MKIAMIARNCSFALVAALFVTLLPGCGSNDPQDEAKQAGRTAADYPTHAGDEFRGLDQRPVRPTAVPPAIPEIPAGPTTPTELVNLEIDNGTLDAGQIKGRNSWVMWTGGNQAFWDYLSTNSTGLVDLLKILDNRHTARNDRFRLMGTIPTPGMRAPDGTVVDQKLIDEEYHGLHLDIPTDEFKNHTTNPDYDVYGYATGIVGLRIWKNPAFNEAAKARWDAERYLYDKNYAASPNLIRPFRVGMACGFCHVSYSPLNPPKDTSDPKWENLSATIGSQYFKMKGIFGPNLAQSNTIWQLFNTYRPGTIDTSLIATDGNNNPNTMNAIFGILPRIVVAAETARETSVDGATDIGTLDGLSVPSALVKELQDLYPADVKALSDLGLIKISPDGVTLSFTNPNRITPRILAAGEDSIGALGALARVYVNIGEFHQQWIKNHTPMVGLNPQNPFSIESAKKNSVFWQVSEKRAHNIARYFITASSPMRLEDARYSETVPVTTATPTGEVIHSGREAISRDAALLNQGAKVFARNCFVCHSSKQPDGFFKNGPADYKRWIKDEAYLEKCEKLVLEPGFRENNYFSTDQRYPITLIGTHSGRAFNDNSVGGRVWDNFSSKDFKDLRLNNPVTSIVVDHPYENRKYTWQVPRSKPANASLYGPGYYRPPSLISMWATAPFLHNNTVGDFPEGRDILKDQDFDVTFKGRLEVYDDAIDKLLNPEKRHGRASIARTTQDSTVHVEYSTLREVISRVSGYQTLFLFRGYPYLIAFLLFVWGAAIIQWGNGNRIRAFQILQISHLVGGVILLVLSFVNWTETNYWWLRWFDWMNQPVDWLYARSGGNGSGDDWWPALVLLALGWWYGRAANDPDAVFRRLTIKFFVLFIVFWIWGLGLLTWLALVGVIFLALGRTNPMVGYKALGVGLAWIAVYLEFFYQSPLAIFGAVEHIVSAVFGFTGLFLVFYGSDNIGTVSKWLGRGVAAMSIVVIVLGAKLERDGLSLGRIPKGTPVNLLGNLNSPGTVNDEEKLRILVDVVVDLVKVQKNELPTLNHPSVPNLVPNLLRVNKCPDFVLDRGHTFGSELSDSDKNALKEYLKTL